MKLELNSMMLEFFQCFLASFRTSLMVLLCCATSLGLMGPLIVKIKQITRIKNDPKVGPSNTHEIALLGRPIWTVLLVLFLRVL
jgi:hypothetical protein